MHPMRITNAHDPNSSSGAKLRNRLGGKIVRESGVTGREREILLFFARFFVCVYTDVYIPNLTY